MLPGDGAAALADQCRHYRLQSDPAPDLVSMVRGPSPELGWRIRSACTSAGK